MSDLAVVAEIIAQPGREAELRAILLALVAPTRDEAGCVSYEMHVDADAPGRFVFIERWADRAALDAHMTTEHIALFRASAPTHVQSMRVTRLDRVA